MKKTLLVLTFTLVVLTLAAQDRAELLRQRLESGRVSFDYSLTVEGKVPVKQSGSVVIDGDCYCIKGNGVEIRCDGTTLWTVDNEAREVYIENFGGVREFLADPAAYLDKVSDLKVGATTASGVYSDASGSVKFNLSSIRSSESGSDGAIFSFDTSALGADWVVTDLR